MGVIETIGQFFRAIAESVGLLNRRIDQRNTPEIKANVSAQKEQEIKEQATDAVTRKDADKVRRLIAE